MASSDKYKVLRYKNDLSPMEKGTLTSPNAPEARMPKTEATPKGYGTGGSMYKMDSYKKGGKVKKTGPAKLHKGEKVIPKSAVKKVEKAVRAAGRDKAMLKKAKIR